MNARPLPPGRVRAAGTQPGKRDERCRRCDLPKSTRVHSNPFGAGHAYEPPAAATTPPPTGNEDTA